MEMGRAAMGLNPEEGLGRRWETPPQTHRRGEGRGLCGVPQVLTRAATGTAAEALSDSAAPAWGGCHQSIFHVHRLCPSSSLCGLSARSGDAVRLTPALRGLEQCEEWDRG